MRTVVVGLIDLVCRMWQPPIALLSKKALRRSGPFAVVRVPGYR
jgi:hypothetical protein